MCNLSFDVVRVLRTQPLCLPTLMSLFLVYDLSFDIIWELTNKKLFLTFTKKIVCNNLLQVCNLIFLSLSSLNSLNLWRLGNFESCHSLQALPTNFKMWSHLVFSSFILSSTCVCFSWTWGASSLEMYEYVYWVVNFKPKSNTNE
jgi:hypothetical protein